MFEIVKSLDYSEKNAAFIALGYYDAGGSPHAGIIIKYLSEHFQFHYTGKSIDFSQLDLDFFHKITYTIDPMEVPAFIAHCKNIYKKANPRYGYFYSGDYFDSEGNHFGNKNLGQRMTCVGFCLSTLKGFLENDYIISSDWVIDPNFRPGYLEYFCGKNSLNIDDVKSSFKRITPGQFIASGFFNYLPIRKSQIDKKYIEIKGSMDKKGIFFE